MPGSNKTTALGGTFPVHSGESWKETALGTAVGVGALAGYRSFAPSLHPRGPKTQVVMTALAVGAGAAVGGAADAVTGGIQRAFDTDALHARAGMLAVTGAGALAAHHAVSNAYTAGRAPSVKLAVARTALALMSGAVLLGGVGDALTGTLSRKDNPDAPVISPPSLVTMAVLGTSWLALATGGGTAFRRISKGMRTAAAHSAVQLPAGSLIPAASIDSSGARFLGSIPNDLASKPIRVFAGLTSAGKSKRNAQLAAQELVRQGGLKRSSILVVSTTGGGHVPPVHVEAFERLLKGDTATVAVQYGNLPSAFSFHRVPAGRRAHQELLTALKAQIDMLPVSERPKVYVYGESLGAWTSQDVFRGGAEAFEKYGVSRTVWTGVPGYSAWKPQLDAPGASVDIQGIAQLPEVTPRIRAVVFNNADDPVRGSSHRLLIESRKLPGSPVRPWTPAVSFFHSIGDVVLSRGAGEAGAFTRHGHDYRQDAPELWRAVLNLNDAVNDSELDALRATLAMSESAQSAVRW